MKALLKTLLNFFNGKTETHAVLPTPQETKTIQIDPVVENLWPIDNTVFSIDRLRHWSQGDLESHLTGDLWMDNLLINKDEFANGRSRLKSFPWRFSVPFVLCNAQCEFCSAWLVKGSPMPIDMFDRLDAVLPYMVQIDLVGWGEPLIHPQLDKILCKLRDRVDSRSRISLTTNGVHLQRWVDQLIDANIREFEVSMHAARPETHEDLMGLPQGSFEKVISGLRTLLDRKRDIETIRVGLTFIVTRQNLEEIPEFITIAENLGADYVFFRTLKGRTEVEQHKDGLDYHRLPPYLHPEFERLRERATDAIAKARIQIHASPETWSNPIFPSEAEARLLAEPTTPREKRRKEFIRTPTPDSDDLPMGEPISEDMTEDDRPNEGLTEVSCSRGAPYFCPTPYTALYLNGFDRLATPCCYMTSVPGHKRSYLKSTATFDNVWNSQAMVALRRRLHEGPLMAPCQKCPYYW